MTHSLSPRVEKYLNDYVMASEEVLQELKHRCPNPQDEANIAACILLQKIQRKHEAKPLRIAWLAFGVSVLALVVAILVWMFPRAPHDTNQMHESHAPTSPAPSQSKP
jgi:hypothetical protein